MGKVRRKRHKPKPHQPTGLPSVKEGENELAETGVDGPSGACGDSNSMTAASLLEKLTSSHVEDREYACAAIATYVSQPGSVSALLDHNIVKTLSPLILDTSVHVQQSAVGALRNLSVDGGPDGCAHMVCKDILTPLVSLLQRYGENFVVALKTEKNKEADIIQDVIVQAVHLLWNLCEGTETAVCVFNKDHLEKYLLPYLDANVYGEQLAVAAAQCLYTVTEENLELLSRLDQTDGRSLIESAMMAATDPERKVYAQSLISNAASGMLCNLSKVAAVDGSTLVRSIAQLTNTLSHDATALLENIAQKIGDIESSEIDKQLLEAGYLLSAQQLALEIIANLCCADDNDGWDDLDSSSSSSDDGTSQVESSPHQNMDIDDASTLDITSPLCIPSDIYGAIVSSGLVQQVLPKTQCLELSDVAQKQFRTQELGRKLIRSYQRIQCHALLCVNNLVSCLEADAFGGIHALEDLWRGLSQVCTTQRALTNVDLLEAVTSALRAVVQKLGALESQQFASVTPADLQLIFELSQQCAQASVRVNAVRIVATIGCLLSKHSEPHILLKDIGTFLLEIVSKDTDLWIVAEALDSIFDVFGEDHINGIISEIGLIEKLTRLLPTLKNKVNSQRETLGEHYPVVSTARTNLIRFIRYKSATENGNKN